VNPQYRIIGKGERRVDALGKVTGRAKYAADYNAGHQLWGKVLRAEHPHARIVRVDGRLPCARTPVPSELAAPTRPL